MRTTPTDREHASLRDSLSLWTSGVTVVTTADPAGKQRGFTATSFSALSMDPPLVLVCLNKSADCRPAFESADALAVHILRSNQAHIAKAFAAKGADKYEGLSTSEGIGGVPLLDGVLSRLECTLVRLVDGGDHVILIGLVRRSSISEGSPLVYFGRSFHDLPTTSRHSSHDREVHTACP